MSNVSWSPLPADRSGGLRRRLGCPRSLPILITLHRNQVKVKVATVTVRRARGEGREVIWQDLLPLILWSQVKRQMSPEATVSVKVRQTFRHGEAFTSISKWLPVKSNTFLLDNYVYDLSLTIWLDFVIVFHVSLNESSNNVFYVILSRDELHIYFFRSL